MWRLAACLRALLGEPASLTARAHGGDGWTREQHLVALAVDALRTANWQRTKDGQRNRNRPNPVSPLSRPQGTRYGAKKTTISPEKTRAYLDRIGPRPRPATPDVTDGG